MDIPALKEGTGKELRKLHDAAQQNLRALQSMEYEPSGPFVTFLLELKLDTNTMFEWQKYSQEKDKVPHYNDLLTFLNLRAQAAESATQQVKKSGKSENASSKRGTNPNLRCPY